MFASSSRLKPGKRVGSFDVEPVKELMLADRKVLVDCGRDKRESTCDWCAKKAPKGHFERLPEPSLSTAKLHDPILIRFFG